jgi:hypothetical protein
MAAVAYLGGPVTGELDVERLAGRNEGLADFAALILLILETQNDYVRFHGKLNAARYPP